MVSQGAACKLHCKNKGQIKSKKFLAVLVSFFLALTLCAKDDLQWRYPQDSGLVMDQIDSLSKVSLSTQNLHFVFSATRELEKWCVSSNYEQGTIKSWLLLGILYNAQNDHQRSLSYYLKALELQEKTNTKKNRVVTLGQIGVALKKLKDYEQAEKYLLQALEIVDMNSEQYGRICINISSLYVKTDELKKAMKYAREAQKIGLEMGDSMSIGASHLLIGGILLDQNNDYEEALRNYQKAMQINKELNEYHLVQASLIDLGSYHRELDQFDSALYYLYKSLEYDSLITDGLNLSVIYRNLADVYEKQGDAEKALFYTKKLNIIEEQLSEQSYSSEFAEKVAEKKLESKNEEIDKLTQLLQQQQSNWPWWVLLGFIITGGIIGFVYYRKQGTLILKEVSLARKETSAVIEQAASDRSSLEVLITNLNSSGIQPHKITLPSMERIVVTDTSKIIRCESSDSYTKFFILNETPVLVSKTLKEFERQLTEHSFFRVHQSHLINIAHIQSFEKRGGGELIMTDGSIVPVAQRKKESFLQFLKNLQ